MAKSYALSLPAAILVNINIMIGSGIFVNTVLLARNAGPFGGAAYLIMGIMLLPLIITFARLLKYHKGGTFYDFGAIMHPMAGFLSGWSYFTAKLASASLGIHVFSTLISQLVPGLSTVPSIVFDGAIVLLFTALNMLNLRIGRVIQYGFLLVKLMPIFCAIGAGIYFFSGASLTGQHLIFSNLVGTLPFVLYAFTGFEACCSLSRTMEDPERNGPRALIISYALGVCIAVLFQTLFFIALPRLGILADYSQAFPALLNKLFASPHGLHQFIFFLLNVGIATSSLGAAYGIMYSNAWNLFALAQAGYTFAGRALTSFNRYKAPFVCVLAEGLTVLLYLIAFRGSLVPLQQICSLGMMITYTVSTAAFLMLMWRLRSRIELTAVLALFSCLLLALGYHKNIMEYGARPTLYFGFIILLGLSMFLLRFHQKKHED